MNKVDASALSRARSEFTANGACCVRGVFDSHWIEQVRQGLDEAATKPSSQAKTWTAEQGQGRFFQDGFAWNRVGPLRNFVFESPAAQLVATLMGSTRVNLYMDHILIREPETDKVTPWHHDSPYCFVDGHDFCTIWLPLDPIALGEGIKLVRGSHQWGKLFLPVEFGSTATYAHEPGAERKFEIVPDIDAARQDEHEILSWELSLGDCVVFYCSMLHAAPAHLRNVEKRRVYSTRWTGNDDR